MAEGNLFQVGKLPQQKSDGSSAVEFPTILFPSKNHDNTVTIPALTESIKSNKSWLEYLLHESGAIIFRGFPVSTPSDFNDIVEAFGYDELPYVGGIASRTKVLGRIYTANESPPDQLIPFHHEMSHAPEFPTKLFFFCEEEPGKGGETPIVLSHVIYERMKEKHPEFVNQIEEQGLIMSRVIAEEDNSLDPVGRGWKSTFMTTDKPTAEERAANLGMTLEWMEGAVRIRMGPMPGIKYDEARKRKIWFNGIAPAYGGLHDALNVDPEKRIMFANGKPFPPDVVYDCLKIMDEECVAVPWHKGDVLLIDNLAVLHARRPLITPPRRILASLCK